MGKPELSLATTAVIAAAHVVFGIAVGRWWTLMLPVAAIILAIPFGMPYDSRGEGVPLFFGIAFYAPFEAVLLALGVGARQAVELLRRKPASRR